MMRSVASLASSLSMPRNRRVFARRHDSGDQQRVITSGFHSVGQPDHVKRRPPDVETSDDAKDLHCRLLISNCQLLICQPLNAWRLRLRNLLLISNWKLEIEN